MKTVKMNREAYNQGYTDCLDGVEPRFPDDNGDYEANYWQGWENCFARFHSED